jgi:hypothetical protein
MGIGVSFRDRAGSSPARISTGVGSEITAKSHLDYFYFVWFPE